MGKVGLAFVVDRGCQFSKQIFTGKIPDKSCVFTAELVEISQALCWLKTTDIKKCVIFSDSLSLLQ